MLLRTDRRGSGPRPAAAPIRPRGGTRSGPCRHPEAHEDTATVLRCPRPLRQIAVRGLGREHPHLDALSSAVALNVDLDATLTVWAQVADDALRRRLPGYQKAGPDTLWRRFVSTRGRITIGPAEVVVRLRSRTRSPVMRSANVPVVDDPWWGGRPLRFELD